MIQSCYRLAVALGCLAVCAILSAADTNPAFTDPEKAGPEFQYQGEYQAEIKTDDGDKKLGVQVIALGDNKFRAVGYIGGLPGDGWSRGGETKMADGQLENGVLQFKQVGSPGTELEFAL